MTAPEIAPETAEKAMFSAVGGPWSADQIVRPRPTAAAAPLAAPAREMPAPATADEPATPVDSTPAAASSLPLCTSWPPENTTSLEKSGLIGAFGAAPRFVPLRSEPVKLPVGKLGNWLRVNPLL